MSFTVCTHVMDVAIAISRMLAPRLAGHLGLEHACVYCTGERPRGYFTQIIACAPARASASPATDVFLYCRRRLRDFPFCFLLSLSPPPSSPGQRPTAQDQKQ